MSKKAAKKKQKQAPEKARFRAQAPAPAKTEGPKKPGRRPSTRLAGSLHIANIILLVILAALCALILIGPFQRGLFFQQELLPVHVLSFGLFILWWVSRFLRRDGSVLRTPLDASIFALVVLYYLSFLFAPASKVGALEEFLKVANYFIIYLMVFDICRQQDLFMLRELKTNAAKKTGDAKQASSAEHGKTLLRWIFPEGISPGLFILLHTLVISGTAVALAGIGTATGTWEVYGAYVGRRIYSPLQYPNTAAAYFTAAYFLSLGLAPLLRRWYLRSLYLVPAVVLAIALVFTFSRGAWLLLPPAALLFLLVLPAGNRLRTFLHLTITGAATLLVLAPLDRAFQTGEAGAAWPYLFFAVCIALAGGMLAEQFLRLNFKLKLAVAGAAALLVAIVGLQFLLPRLERPLYLERSLHEEPAHQYLEQRVSSIEGLEQYFLTFDVNSTWEVPPGDEEPGYAWRLLVTGYDLEEESTTLLDHREGPTAGWEPRELEFETAEDTARLEVRLYNHFPGTAVTARDFVLRDSVSETSLSFALDKVLPRQLYTRIFAIGAGERSVDARFTFYRDALRIVGDYPVLGAGGGGWNALYHGYQERGYFTTEVHSHFLQVWVETGTLGFLAFLGIWIFFTLSFLRARLGPHLEPLQKTAYSAIFLSALALGAHSALDFNLSLGAVSFFLFALLGAGRSLGPAPGQSELALPRLPRLDLSARPYWIPVLAGGLVTVILFFFTLSLWNGYRDARVATRYYQENRVQESVDLLERSLRRHPYRVSSYTLLADIYDQAATHQESPETASRLRARALELSRQAWQLEPYSTSHHLNLGARLLQFGQIDEALTLVEETIALHPHSEQIYIQVARAYLSTAAYYEQQGLDEQAREKLQRLLELETLKRQYHDELGSLSFYLGQAALQLKKTDLALAHFEAVDSRQEEYSQALAYRRFLYRERGEEEKVSEIEEAFAADEKARAFYEDLRQGQAGEPVLELPAENE